MELRELQCFLSVAESLHFGRTAERLHLSQATVSESVKRLEIQLGGPLFERTTRRVNLTQLGERFLVDAGEAYEHIVQVYERGRAVAQEYAGRFVLGHNRDVADQLVNVVCELRRKTPGVEVILREMSTQYQFNELRSGRIHAALCWGLGAEPDDPFEVDYLDSAELVAVVPEHHKLAQRSCIALHEIATEPIVIWQRTAAPDLYDAFCDAMSATGVSWESAGNFPGDLANVSVAVLSGLGVGVVIDRYVAPPGLAVVPLEEKLAIRRALAWRRDERHPALRKVKLALATALK
jgi:DNA-binding transcriptional LysR family regulator